ncbi:MAG: polysaccharide biosynthesis protein [Lachnospiraceae bacterium]|nr:polysaccharide biosynthesis protein [Lachnospiraceae bacterium]
MNLPFHLTPGKRAFLTGTLLLTATGFACRVLGFFYRIFLSRTIGAEGLGIYNMVHPIFGICFALCAGSIQTALSQYIASHAARGRSIFRTGLMLSMSLSFVLAFLICRHAPFLAARVLMEPQCAPYLPIMGISVPFAALHACINGYYYGMQKSHVPAFSQITEQIIRMTLVFLLADAWISAGKEITVQLAVLGHLMGEIASAAFTLICLYVIPPQRCRGLKPDGAPVLDTTLPLLTLALPLMGNRLVLNLLASAEAIWIPNRLQASGLSASEAFSVYGVLTGMALPFILFPSAITNSMAVLLLPSVAQAQAEGRKGRIAESIALSLRYSLYMGILCIGIFVLFGNALGTSVFHDSSAGHYIRILAWLCPFLYLATTLGSILNGLGRTRTTFLQNTAALLLRIVFVLVGIPRYGILAYLWGMLVSELFLALLHLWSLRRRICFSWNAWEMLVKPILLLLISIGIHHFTSGFFPVFAGMPTFLVTSLHILLICFCYGGLLLLFHFGKAQRVS